MTKFVSAIDSFRWMLGLFAAILIGGFAFLGVQVTRVGDRVSSISTDVQALPGKINSDLLELTRTLADGATGGMAGVVKRWE